MKKENLQVGQEIYFVGEKLPMAINSLSDRYAVCTRKPNYNEDRGFIKQHGSWDKIKNELIYACLDFKLQWKAPHNSYGYEIKTQEDCDAALEALKSGEIELSRRNHVVLDINWEKTFNK